MAWIKSRESKINLILATIIVIASLIVLTYSALELAETERERGGRGYVTDEVWYVSAARNILIRVFGGEPRQDPGRYGATILFQSSVDVARARSIASSLNLSIKTDYSKINAVYVEGKRENVFEFAYRMNITQRVVDIVPGWQLPDSEVIHTYINHEHPPLAKYLIALSMIIFGDSPFYWRIPVVIIGAVTTLFVFLVLLELSNNRILAFLGTLLFLFDSMTRAIFSIAILDGFVAAFTVISLYYALKSRYKQALVVALVGGLFKATGLFAAIPSVLLLARNITKRSRGDLGEFLYNTVYFGLLGIVLYVSLLTIVSLPIIHYMGVSNWINNALLGSVSWHLSAKCTDPARCARWSDPWEWFLGYHSFPLYVFPNGRTLYAEGFYPLWFASLVLGLISLPLVYIKRNYGKTLLYLLGVFSGYIIIWILGSRTQYSFYAIQLTPLVYINLAYLIYTFGETRNLNTFILKSWFDITVKTKKILEFLILS